jgi:type IX secretion system PorP/SprF family membrane protein
MYQRILLRLLLIVFLLSAIPSLIRAQQDPQFTHNMFNHAFVNPGSYGLNDGITVTGIFREQWLGFKDYNDEKVAPETFLLTADAPIRFLHGGVGIGIAQDKEAQIKNMLVKLGYSFHLNLGNAKLGFGLNANFNNKSIDKEKLNPIDQSDPVLLGLSGDGVMISDMALGVFLQKPRYYIALSSTQVLETTKTAGTADGVAFYKNRRHYYLTGGHDIVLPAFQGYVFTPSLFIKSDGKTIQADANLMARYNNKVWGGLSYRINDAVALMVGVAYKDIEIGYSYDIPTSRIAATGSHEIMARYRFKLEREKTRTGYRNTRYL